MRQFRFSPALPESPAFTLGDAVILLGIASMLYAGTRLAFHVPAVIAGPDISLSPLALPWYALLSVGRMAVAYFLSLIFSLFMVTPPLAIAPLERCSCPCWMCFRACLFFRSFRLCCSVLAPFCPRSSRPNLPPLCLSSLRRRGI